MRWERIRTIDLREKVLRANGEFHAMTSFLAILPLPAFIKDRAGRFLYLNAQAETLWETKLKDAIGKKRSDFILDPDFHDRTEQNDRRILRTNSARVFYHSEPKGLRHAVLKFTFEDSEGDRLIGGIVVPM